MDPRRTTVLLLFRAPGDTTWQLPPANQPLESTTRPWPMSSSQASESFGDGWRGWQLAAEGPLDWTRTREWTSLFGARFDRRARAKSRVVQQRGAAGKGIGCLRRTCSLGTIAPATAHGRIRARHQSSSAGLGAAGSERLSTSGLVESQCVWGRLARVLIA
ncbi:predicted protein [Histoplasma capsulatum var. duboisii H88]|uniref:Predicted protein n=1 Tax=Ajellomyces capsulatus (strain H88) TaxID=544711 RepID=F0UDY8_AJEC8|nr:predicted protein [Histoplasma capsulatum var. duboisii H88]